MSRSHSWLSYGVVKVRERLWSQLVSRHSSSGESSLQVYNPCINVGYTEEHSPEHTLVGIGNPSLCVAEIKQLIWPETDCESGFACSIDGIQHPKVGPEFYGMSVYFFALDCVKHFVGDTAKLHNW
jgi:hypothetical protein